MNFLIFLISTFLLSLVFNLSFPAYCAIAFCACYIIGILCYQYPQLNCLKLHPEDNCNLLLKNYSFFTLELHLMLIVRGIQVALKVSNKKI